MSKLSYPNSEIGQIKYANAAAVAIGQPIFVSGIGVVIAAGAYDAAEEGIYYTEGVFQFKIATGVTITRGTRCFYDVSGGDVITTGMAAEDLELGRAIEAGTAEAGYVNIQIGRPVISAANGVTAAKIAALVGTHTAIVTTASVETITDVRISSLDTVFAQIASVVATGGTLTKINVLDGSFTCAFSTQVAGAPINYQVFK